MTTLAKVNNTYHMPGTKLAILLIIPLTILVHTTQCDPCDQPKDKWSSEKVHAHRPNVIHQARCSKYVSYNTNKPAAPSGI